MSGLPISVPENMEYISPVKQALVRWLTQIQEGYDWLSRKIKGNIYTFI